MADAFGHALLDHYRGERDAPLVQRDGDDVLEHPVEDFYFGAFEDEPGAQWTASRLDGPVLDVGAGAGRDALYFQERFETVALDVSARLVRLLAERGVADARRGDMAALSGQFPRDRFGSVLSVGTQTGLVKSREGLREFLGALATITTPGATTVIDGYDPTWDGATEMLGFRSDPTTGLAYRVLHYEYGDLVGDTLLFRLFSPDRVRGVAADTPWHVDEVHRPHESYYYRLALTKD